MDDNTDEFRWLGENAAEFSLAWSGQPIVRRVEVPVSDRRTLSALAWGEGRPSLVLLHGGGQNAHSWDTTALVLNQPLLAVDLPGHGHSSWRSDGEYRPERLAADVVVAIKELARPPVVLVGMSMGGMVTAAVARLRPDLLAGVVLVDVTPAALPTDGDPTVMLLRHDRTFPSFEAMLDVTAEHNPRRSEVALRRGLRHNARALPDGRWTWRYDDLYAWTGRGEPPVDPEPLWEALHQLNGPVHLVRGELSDVVTDADVAHLLRLRPGATVVTIDGAGHNVQGEQPVALGAFLVEVIGSLSSGGARRRR